MRNLDNVFSDVVSQYTVDTLEYKIIQSCPEESLWVVNVYNLNAPGSHLQIEVMEDDGIPLCCVLDRVNVGYKSMFRFMNRLMVALD